MVALLVRLFMQSTDRLGASKADQNRNMLNVSQELLSLAPAKKRMWRSLAVTTPTLSHSLRSLERDP